MPGLFCVFFLFFSISLLLLAAALTAIVGTATSAAAQIDSVKSWIADLVTRFSM